MDTEPPEGPATSQAKKTERQSTAGDLFPLLKVSPDGVITDVNRRTLTEYFPSSPDKKEQADLDPNVLVGHRVEEFTDRQTARRFRPVLVAVNRTGHGEVIRPEQFPLLKVQTVKGERVVRVRPIADIDPVTQKITGFTIGLEDVTDLAKHIELKHWILEQEQMLSQNGIEKGMRLYVEQLAELVGTDVIIVLSEKKGLAFPGKIHRVIASSKITQGLEEFDEEGMHIDDLSYKVLVEGQDVMVRRGQYEESLRHLREAGLDVNSAAASPLVITDKDGQKEILGGVFFLDNQQVRFTGADLDILKQISGSVATILKLLEKASIDNLTGLPNRSLFEERFSQILDEAWRHRQEISLRLKDGETLDEKDQHVYISMISGDVDRLKYLNERYSLTVGDSVIQVLAQLWRDGLRATDAVCRYTADSFVHLAPGCLPEGAVAIAERFRRRVAESVEKLLVARHQNIEFEQSPSMSLGIATIDLTEFPADKPLESFKQQIADDLLVWSDYASHEAKQGGRDRTYLYRGKIGTGRLTGFSAIDHVTCDFDKAEHLQGKEKIVKRVYIRSDTPPPEMVKFQGGKVDTVLEFEVGEDGQETFTRGYERYYFIEKTRGLILDESVEKSITLKDLEEHPPA